VDDLNVSRGKNGKDEVIAFRLDCRRG